MKDAIITLEGQLLDVYTGALITPALTTETADRLMLRINAVARSGQDPVAVPLEEIYVPFIPRLADHRLLWHAGDRLVVTGQVGQRFRFDQAELLHAQRLRQRERQLIRALTLGAVRAVALDLPAVRRLVVSYQGGRLTLAQLQARLAALPSHNRRRLVRLYHDQNSAHWRTARAIARTLTPVGVMTSLSDIRTVGIAYHPEEFRPIRMTPAMWDAPDDHAALLALIAGEAAALRSAGHLECSGLATSALPQARREGSSAVSAFLAKNPAADALNPIAMPSTHTRAAKVAPIAVTLQLTLNRPERVLRITETGDVQWVSVIMATTEAIFEAGDQSVLTSHPGMAIGVRFDAALAGLNVAPQDTLTLSGELVPLMICPVSQQASFLHSRQRMMHHLAEQIRAWHLATRRTDWADFARLLNALSQNTLSREHFTTRLASLVPAEDSASFALVQHQMAATWSALEAGAARIAVPLTLIQNVQLRGIDASVHMVTSPAIDRGGLSSARYRDALFARWQATAARLAKIRR